jgi:hypothetical protein
LSATHDPTAPRGVVSDVDCFVNRNTPIRVSGHTSGANLSIGAISARGRLTLFSDSFPVSGQGGRKDSLDELAAFLHACLHHVTAALNTQTEGEAE